MGEFFTEPRSPSGTAVVEAGAIPGVLLEGSGAESLFSSPLSHALIAESKRAATAGARK
jgi:hypothetical protein